MFDADAILFGEIRVKKGYFDVCNYKAILERLFVFFL